MAISWYSLCLGWVQHWPSPSLCVLFLSILPQVLLLTCISALAIVITYFWSFLQIVFKLIITEGISTLFLVPLMNIQQTSIILKNQSLPSPTSQQMATIYTTSSPAEAATVLSDPNCRHIHLRFMFYSFHPKWLLYPTSFPFVSSCTTSWELTSWI